jgi:hypothetical protein
MESDTQRACVLAGEQIDGIPGFLATCSIVGTLFISLKMKMRVLKGKSKEQRQDILEHSGTGYFNIC